MTNSYRCHEPASAAQFNQLLYRTPKVNALNGRIRLCCQDFSSFCMLINERRAWKPLFLWQHGVVHNFKSSLCYAPPTSHCKQIYTSCKKKNTIIYTKCVINNVMKTLWLVFCFKRSIVVPEGFAQDGTRKLFKDTCFIA